MHLICDTYQELLKKNNLKTKFFIVPGYAYEITFPETLKFIQNSIDTIRSKFLFVKELIFKKPKLPWNEILETKGYPIYSKQFSVLLNRIQRVKSKNGLTRWIFKINTSKFGISKNRLYLLDKQMRIFPNHNDNPLIDDNYFGPSLYNNNYMYSEKCCNYIKGDLKKIKLPIFVGTMASESELRKQSWIKFGCNIISNKKKISRPLSIWTEKDIWKYILKYSVDINQKYGFVKEIVTNYNDNNQIDNMMQKLKYKRLGCISCPYGAHMEKDKNRFEILKEQSEFLYQSQVIKNGMYKVLIDMNIEIKTDPQYMQLYGARHKQIALWYEDINNNIFSVIAQIENFNNYKKYKNEKSVWSYEFDEIKQILKNYNVDLENNEIKDKIRKSRKYWFKHYGE